MNQIETGGRMILPHRDTDGYRILAVDPVHGSIRWAVDLADPNQPWYRPPQYCNSTSCKPSPMDADGWSEPVVGPDGTLYVSLDDPYLRAVDPKGKILWGLDLGDPNRFSPAASGPDSVVNLGGFTLTVDQKGSVYAAQDDGNLYVVSSKGTLVAQFKDSVWFGHPVLTRQGGLLMTANTEGPDPGGLVMALNAEKGAKP